MIVTTGELKHIEMGDYMICPACGENEMESWHMDIYECPNCKIMIPIDDLEMLESEANGS